MNKLNPFKWFVLQNFPFIEADFDALTNYELMCKVVEYLNETIAKTNELGEQVEALTNWFNNLDVQEEINNKLDEMVQSGELQELLSGQYEELKSEVNADITNFENTTNQNITAFENQATTRMNNFENKVNTSLSGLSTALSSLTTGTPLVASSTSEMTDTSRIYVNTADGNWYYYDGDSWEIGGEYQSSGIADGSVDVLSLSDLLQANFSLRYGEDIDKGEGYAGGCKGSVGSEITIDTSLSDAYKYYIVNLEEGGIYTFTGKQPSGLRAILITDSNNIIKLRPPSDSTGAVVSCTFKVNQAGMKAYISRMIQTTTGSNVDIYKFEDSFRIRKLVAVGNNLKVENHVPLLQTINNYMIPGQTLNEGLKISQINDVFIYCYPMEKGKHYITKSYHYSYAKAYAITDSKYVVLSQDATPSGGSATLITNEFTATEDGYIYLSTNNTTTRPVSIEAVFNIEVEQKEYEMIKGKTICYDGDSICQSRTSGNASNGGAFAKIIADITASNYVNQAVGGGHLAHWTQTERHCVVDNLENLPTNADMYVFCAGINDFWGDAEIGVTTADYTTTVDDTTIKGAMEKIFRYCLNNMPSAKILFVIEHKIQNTAITENDNHDTFKDYHDAMIEICNKYSIPYYDAFNNSNLNGWNSYQSALYLTANNEQTADGTHPNEDGYKKFYVPQMLEIYKSILEKEEEA